MAITVGVNVWARGRIAWILAMIVGLAGIIAGAAIGAAKSWTWNHGVAGWLIGTGAAFAVVGLIFLVMSYVTHGRTD